MCSDAFVCVQMHLDAFGVFGNLWKLVLSRRYPSTNRFVAADVLLRMTEFWISFVEMALSDTCAGLILLKFQTLHAFCRPHPGCLEAWGGWVAGKLGNIN